MIFMECSRLSMTRASSIFQSFRINLYTKPSKSCSNISLWKKRKSNIAKLKVQSWTYKDLWSKRSVRLYKITSKMAAMNRWIMNSLLKMMKISNRLRNTQKNKRKSKRRHSKSQKKLSCIKMWHKNIHQALALIFLQKFDNRWRYYLIKNYNKEKKRKKD